MSDDTQIAPASTSLASRVERLERQYDSLADTVNKVATDVAVIREKIGGLDKAVGIAFNSAEKAIAAALSAQEKTVVKAEVATEKRFENVNEWRQTYGDMVRVDQGRGSGTSQAWAYVLAVASLAIAAAAVVAMIVVALVK